MFKIMNFSQNFLFFTCLTCFFSLCHAGNILVVLPMGTKSHYNVFAPLVEELAERNHTITFISLLQPSKTNKNVEYIVVDSADDFSKKWSDMMSRMLSNSVSFAFIKEFGELMVYGCDGLYKDQQFQSFRDLIKKKKLVFDAVLTMPVLNECILPWTATLGAPLILISPSVVLQNTAWVMNIPYPLSYVATPILPFNSTMTFTQRVINVLSSLSYLAIYKFYLMKRTDEIARKYVENGESALDVMSNASLLFVNTHFSLDEPKPHVPHVIDVGGMHCRPGTSLPKIFEDFVESSGDDGFIVMSMGSVVQGNRLPKEFTSLFRRVFTLLKQKVIWKFEDTLEGITPNVMLSKWIPQQDLMAHPKCRLAITHGGLLSLQEVVYHGVPLLGVPLGADRDFNINQAVNKGLALILDWTTAKPEQTVEKINALIYDEKYKNKAKELSELTRDRPHQPLETAVFWVEYVIRHRGAAHLKNAGAQHLNLIQYLGIDVIGFLIGIIAAGIYALILIIKFTINKCIFRKTKLKINKPRNKQKYFKKH